MWVSTHTEDDPLSSTDFSKFTPDFKGFKHQVANIKSQIKRIKTNRKATERNRAVKSELRTLARQTREAVLQGDRDLAEQKLRAANRKLDKAVSKGVIHRNQAANRKSALAKKVNAL